MRRKFLTHFRNIQPFRFVHSVNHIPTLPKRGAWKGTGTVCVETSPVSHREFLLQLLRDEIDSRQQARQLKFLNTAGFPRRYSVDQYRTDEIDFPSGVSFQSLLDLDFLKKGNNVIMYGGTGTGKTMLSILIG